ncbi:hypothetical protein [Rahnella sikkimica]|uniref:Uncharacterized protein n=1 Tax=Rahnella sikkimica TaxID=1805933 RepID=A0A2L1URX1_9GAMM|nr:hypothetical protein [Rahnella sikkimica]AVF35680.1 hypothetical protein BV494_12415 [Rahnella sikkimica]
MLLRPPVREHLLPLMDGLLHEFSSLHRLSGCDDAELAAQRMVSLLQEQGLDARLKWKNRAQNVKGKIVIAGQGFEYYVQRLCTAGALGLIHIWGLAESALLENADAICRS